MTRILIADDHPIVRDGLKSLLNLYSEMTVVGEANDGEQAIAMASELKPDLLLLDIGMPKLNGLQVLQKIKSLLPEMKVLVLSQYDSEEYLFSVLRYGASGYLLKETSSEELISAIHTVVNGKIYLSPIMVQALVSEFLALEDSTVKVKDSLTSREEEVLLLVAQGNTSKAIAEKLSISVKTAQTHRYHIMEKLGLHNQTEIVKYAIRKGIIAENE